MREKPILFSSPMVRAILDGRKTQTRRVCKPAEKAGLSRVIPAYNSEDGEQCPPCMTPGWFGDEDGDVLFYSPYGQPGDQLWVRETFELMSHNAGGRIVGDPFPRYAADTDGEAFAKWTPSIFMPRWASRITLQINGVRVERLQEISYEDALAEGVSDLSALLHEDWRPLEGESGDECARRLRWPQRLYKQLWQSINGPGSWDTNPWVWIVEFESTKP